MTGRRAQPSAGELAPLIERWFASAARELPWRVPPRTGTLRRDSYCALVAEAMLQQTQVSRVIEKYRAFIARFPTVHDLARADEHDVLAMWTGLGYYRRARHLHAAARQIVEDHGGVVPSDVAALRSLKGVGRYTAGAVASLAFDRPAPIVDGNVARVLLRVHGRDAASDDPSVQDWLWERAEELARGASSPGDANEGLMELGATVCVPAPAKPGCDRCPLARSCQAMATGRQLEIPRPKARAKRAEARCVALRVERADGAVLLVRRPARGMWAGMWQVPTVEQTGQSPTSRTLAGQIARDLGVSSRSVTADEPFEFLATHRRLMFHGFRASVPGGCVIPPAMLEAGARFCTLEEAERLPMSTPQRRIVLGKK